MSGGRAGLDQARGIGALVTRGVRVRDDDHRQTHGGHLGQRRGPGATHDQVGRGQRGDHVLAQERIRPIAPTAGLGEGLPAGQGGRVAVVAGDVDDGQPLDESRQRFGDRRVEPADGLRPPEDEQDPLRQARWRAVPEPRHGRWCRSRGSASR